MSKTLCLTTHLLQRARRLQDMGLDHAARAMLDRLVGLRQLPRDIAEEAQHRLAGLASDADEPAHARRHLAAALTHRPDHPDYHFEMAQAIEADPADADSRALSHYRTAVRLAPEDMRIRCHLGLLLLRLGQTDEGLATLRHAHETAPGDRDVLDLVATGLTDAGHEEEARRLLRAALFRNSGDRRFRDLYRQHQFRWLSADQARRASIAFPRDESVLLPFQLPSAPRKRTVIDGQIIRLDAPEPSSGPRRPAQRATRRKQSP